jgi:hypothetical protein
VLYFGGNQGGALAPRGTGFFGSSNSQGTTLSYDFMTRRSRRKRRGRNASASSRAATHSAGAPSGAMPEPGICAITRIDDAHSTTSRAIQT